tara:strand:+ start:1094 stop:1252 length:159 start_codon:yes stop_codon:yes gene_type:complete
MSTYKFFFISDSTKEAIGKIYASNLESAFIKASRKKKLSLEHFKQLFDIEKL